MVTEVHESGRLYFFYRPQSLSGRVKRIDDVCKFYVLMHPATGDSLLRRTCRLLMVGQKAMPQLVPGKTAEYERNWALVDFVARDSAEMAQMLGPLQTASGREVAPAQPVGIATYQMVVHNGQAELAYRLVAPQSPGPVQHMFGISPEASYIVRVKNPEYINPAFTGVEKEPEYPEALEILFDGDWMPVKDERLLDYENAQVLLIAARLREVERGLGIIFERVDATQAIDELYEALRLREGECPKDPLIRGTWPGIRASA